MLALLILLVATNLITFVLLVWLTAAGVITFGSLQPLEVANLAMLAATVVLAGVGFVVAVAAFLGYREIKDAAVKAAREVAKETATSVATRTAFETKPSATGNAEANEIAAAVDTAGWTGNKTDGTP